MKNIKEILEYQLHKWFNPDLFPALVALGRVSGFTNSYAIESAFCRHRLLLKYGKTTNSNGDCRFNFNKSVLANEFNESDWVCFLVDHIGTTFIYLFPAARLKSLLVFENDRNQVSVPVKIIKKRGGVAVEISFPKEMISGRLCELNEAFREAVFLPALPSKLLYSNLVLRGFTQRSVIKQGLQWNNGIPLRLGYFMAAS